MAQETDVIKVRASHIRLMRCYECGADVDKAFIFKQANEVEIFQYRYLCFKCVRGK